MALVIVGLAGGQARPQREQRLGATERLDLRFLVQTQYHGLRRRGQIQAHHIVHLLFRRGVGRELERRDPMGLQRVPLPDPVHGGVRQPGLGRQVAGRPVREAGRGRFQRQGHDPRPLARGDRRRPSGFWTIGQSRHPALREAPPNAADLHHHGVAETALHASRTGEWGPSNARDVDQLAGPHGHSTIGERRGRRSGEDGSCMLHRAMRARRRWARHGSTTSNPVRTWHVTPQRLGKCRRLAVISIEFASRGEKLFGLLSPARSAHLLGRLARLPIHARLGRPVELVNVREPEDPSPPHQPSGISQGRRTREARGAQPHQLPITAAENSKVPRPRSAEA